MEEEDEAAVRRMLGGRGDNGSAAVANFGRQSKKEKFYTPANNNLVEFRKRVARQTFARYAMIFVRMLVWHLGLCLDCLNKYLIYT